MQRFVPLLMFVVGCSAQSWLGTWAGSATLNDGRTPTTATGTLTITTGVGIPAPLMLSFRGSPAGSTKEFRCAGGLSTATATATTATLASGGTCALTVTPEDGCTWEALFNSGELTLAPSSLAGTGNGRITTTCSGAGSRTSDFGFTLEARQP